MLVGTPFRIFLLSNLLFIGSKCGFDYKLSCKDYSICGNKRLLYLFLEFVKSTVRGILRKREVETNVETKSEVWGWPRYHLILTHLLNILVALCNVWTWSLIILKLGFQIPCYFIRFIKFSITKSAYLFYNSQNHWASLFSFFLVLNKLKKMKIFQVDIVFLPRRWWFPLQSCMFFAHTICLNL